MELYRTADGRTIEYVDAGDPGGVPVVYLHGTPGTAQSVGLIDAAARRQGVRLVAASRPGYGQSSMTPPGLTSVARDLGELVSALEVDEFALLGASGGGPFALATAAVLASRVSRVLVAAGVAPVYVVAPDSLEEADVEALDLLSMGNADRAMAIELEAVRKDFDPIMQVPLDEFASAMSGNAPPGEGYFDTRPLEERTLFFADLHRGLEGYDGFIRDNLSWLGPWDFDLGEVAAPVDLCYGAADRMSPSANGEWLASRLRSATLTVHPRATHGEICFGLAERLFATVH